MSKEYWKTNAKSLAREAIIWPSLRQILGQVGFIAVLVLIWGGLLAVFLQATAPPPEETEVVAAPPTASNTPSPTNTAVPPTATESNTAVPDLTTTVLTNTDDITATEPSPTDTPTPEPTPTPIPPTDTPVPEGDTASVSFSQDVLPILDKRCVKCHGGEKTEEGLVLTSYADLMAGSWNGSILEPGDAANSYFIQQLIEGEMPKKNPRLLPREINIISDWVDAGAPDN